MTGREPDSALWREVVPPGGPPDVAHGARPDDERPDPGTDQPHGKVEEEQRIRQQDTDREDHPADGAKGGGPDFHRESV